MWWCTWYNLYPLAQLGQLDLQVEMAGKEETDGKGRKVTSV